MKNRFGDSKGITPILMFEYPGWPNVNKLAQAGWLTPGGLLAWHHDVPLVVLERGITWPRTAFRGMTESQYQDLKATRHSMQVDLSTRSKYCELRIAEESGHYIQTQQPELVVKAIHDVLGRSPRYRGFARMVWYSEAFNCTCDRVDNLYRVSAA
jgi:hypothetical protein